MPLDYRPQFVAPLRRTSPLIRLVLTIAIVVPTVSAASPLDDLKRSQVMRDLRASENSGENFRNKSSHRYVKGLDPTSNFASLWATPFSAGLLVGWGNIKVPHYNLKRSISTRTENGVKVEATIDDGRSFELDVTIMIPHPTIEPLVQGGIIKEYSQFTLPPDQTDTSRSIPLEGGTGTFYQSVQGTCSIVIPVSRSGVINVASKNCLKTDEMLNVVKQFDLVRLNRKLNT